MKEAGEEKKLELTPTGRVKKRKMKRKPARFKQELKEKTGLSYEGTIKGLRIDLQNKKNRIKVLEQRIRDFKENEGKVVHELNKLHRRELRKKDTIYKKLQKTYEEFKERKGQRHRSIIYKNKYKTYEHPKEVKRFEETCISLNTNGRNGSYIEIFELFVKVLRHLETYNNTNQTELTLVHYLVLLNLYFLKETLGGVTAPKIILPQHSPHVVRKAVNQLADYGLILRMSKTRFRINMLGEDLLKDIKNFDSFGKSEVVEAIKNLAGYFKY